MKRLLIIIYLILLSGCCSTIPKGHHVAITIYCPNGTIHSIGTLSNESVDSIGRFMVPSFTSKNTKVYVVECIPDEVVK